MGAEQHKETLLATVKEAATALKEECARLETESSSDHMNTQQKQIAHHAQEIQNCRAELEDRARLMHAQHVQEIDELRMGFEMRLENQKLEYLGQANEVREQKLSIDTLILSHEQELEKFRQELSSSKTEIAQQAKEIRELNDKLLDKERALRAQEVLNSTLTRPTTMPSQGATAIPSMAPQASSNQHDMLSSSFSRIPMTTQFPIQKDILSSSIQKDILSSSFSRALMSTTTIPLTSQTEALSPLDVATATAGSYSTHSESLSNIPTGSMPTTTTTSAFRRTEATLDPVHAPAYLDNVTAKDVGDWITCRAPIPEAIGMPFRRLQSRLGLFNPDKLVTPDELEKALNRLSVVAYGLQDLKDAIEALNNQYDSGANGSRGIQVKHLVQALLTNPTYVLPGNPEMQARVQNIGASLTHQACKILTSALEAPGGRLP